MGRLGLGRRGRSLWNWNWGGLFDAESEWKEVSLYEGWQGCGQKSQNVEGAQEVSLYRNIAKKRARIKAGSGEKMRKPGTKGAPTAKAFRAAAKTAKKK